MKNKGEKYKIVLQNFRRIHKASREFISAFHVSFKFLTFSKLESNTFIKFLLP